MANQLAHAARQLRLQARPASLQHLLIHHWDWCPASWGKNRDPIGGKEDPPVTQSSACPCCLPPPTAPEASVSGAVHPTSDSTAVVVSAARPRTDPDVLKPLSPETEGCQPLVQNSGVWGLLGSFLSVLPMLQKQCSSTRQDWNPPKDLAKYKTRWM